MPTVNSRLCSNCYGHGITNEGHTCADCSDLGHTSTLSTTAEK
ncbi:hypothetical protein [Nocardiopsis sp. FR6]|nr:hypothetical protein [Nocardiopsis sp. FR6]